MIKKRIISITSLSLLLLFLGAYQVSSQKEINMGGSDYSFIFEDRIILGEDDDQKPTSTRLFVSGAAEFTDSVIAALPNFDNELAPKAYVDPYLTFWNVLGDGHIHNATDGRVGINMIVTSTPQAQLQVNAPSGVEGLRLVTSDFSPFNIRNSADTADIWRIDQTGSLATGTIPWERLTGAPSNIGSNWSVSGDNVYRLTGNVGVGTDNPLRRLDIKQSVNNDAGGIGIIRSDSTSSGHIYMDSSSNLHIERSGYPSQLILADNGNVGIGTATPSTKLSVNGAAYFTGTARIATPFDDDQAVSLGYVSPYLTFWNTDGDDHVHSVNEGRIGINMNLVDTPGAQLQVNAPSGVEGLRIVSASNHSPLNIRNSANTADIWRVDQAGSLATGTIPWERVTNIPTNFASNWTVSGNDIYRLTGNVGIGTSNPGYKLDVDGTVNTKGNLTVTEPSGSDQFLIQPGTMSATNKIGVGDIGDGFLGGYAWGFYTTDSTDGQIKPNMVLRGGSAQGRTEFYADGTEVMRINNDGNVGIGTNSPGAKLSVFSAISGNMISLNGGYISGLDHTPFDPDHAVPLAYLQNNYISTSTISASGGWTVSGNDIYNSNSGNVGIGTTSPSEKLEVNGKIKFGNNTVSGENITFDGSTSPGMRVTNSSGYVSITPLNAGWAHLYTDRSRFIFNTEVQIIGGVLNAYNNTDLRLGTASNAEKMRITTGGNVGIGTTTPSAKLDVNGDVVISGPVSITENNSGGVLRLARGSGNPTIKPYGYETWMIVDGNNNLGLNYYANGNVIIANGGGNAAIGSTSASEKLHVHGNILASGHITATAFYYSSDARLKENVKTLNEALEKIKRINPVEFSWKEGGEVSHGFIAQELELVVPELVKTNKETGLKSVQYANLTALLTAGMQEQERRIEQLQTEIEILKIRLNSLDK